MPGKERDVYQGAFNAETESIGSYIGLSGNWDCGGNSAYLRDGGGCIKSGDGKSCDRERDRPAVHEVPYGTSRIEQLRKKIQRGSREIARRNAADCFAHR